MPVRPIPFAWRWRAVAATLLLSLAGAASAQGFGVSCPMRVQSLAARVDEGSAEGFSAAFHGSSFAYLVGVSAFDGPPHEGRLVEPVVHGDNLHWRFDAIRGLAVLLCRYEGGIGLGRTLGRGVRQCTVTVARGRPLAPGTTLPQRTVFQCD